MKAMRRIFDKTFLMFLFVGLINTIIGTSVMFSCYNILHCGYWFSSAANYVVGSAVSYFLNKNITFQVQEKNKKYLVRFIINISVCYFLAYGIAKPIAESVLLTMPNNIQENGAMLVGMGLFVVLNYLGQRFFTFKTD